MSVRKNTFVSSFVKVVCVKFSITIMINQKIMNKIFDTPATPVFRPNFPYVIFVGGVSFRSFDCLDFAERCFGDLLSMEPSCDVSLVYYPQDGDNKETSDV